MKTITFLTNEVADHMVPVVRDFFIDMYEHPENFLDPDQKDASNQLIKFQLALKKIPNWTNTQIKKNIDDINNRCNWFKQLLVALFVSHVKMIKEGIRTSLTRRRKFDVKLPSDETFVHTCFVTCAHNLYEDPYVMKESERVRNEQLDARLQKCVLKSIYKLIPTREIIMSELNETTGNDDILPDDVPEPVSEPQSDPLSAQPTSTAVLPAEDEEPKTINVPKSPQQPPDLFPDAPDEKPSLHPHVDDDEEENDVHK